MRHSGLRITDAVTLGIQAIDSDGVLTLRTAKTGTEVRIPLPPQASTALDDVAQPNGYFFWSERGTKKSCVGDYQRAFKKLYKLAGVANGHAHRWRDTFSIELLLAGVPIVGDSAWTLLDQSDRKTLLTVGCGSPRASGIRPPLRYH